MTSRDAAEHRRPRAGNETGALKGWKAPGTPVTAAQRLSFLALPETNATSRLLRFA
jgi:hypothetical protein